MTAQTVLRRHSLRGENPLTKRRGEHGQPARDCPSRGAYRIVVGVKQLSLRVVSSSIDPLGSLLCPRPHLLPAGFPPQWEHVHTPEPGIQDSLGLGSTSPLWAGLPVSASHLPPLYLPTLLRGSATPLTSALGSARTPLCAITL